MQKIIGRKPVLEAINSGAPIERIVVLYGQHGDSINKIKIAAKKRKIKISQVSPSKFKQYEKGKNSQGVVAFYSMHKNYTIDELIEFPPKSKFPLLVILDSIQDPHNVGAIFRTAECAGVDGVILTERNSASVNETVEKTSAGAVSHIKMAKVGNLNNALKKLKSAGYWIAGSYLGGDSKIYTDLDYNLPLALIIGNEEKGIQKLVSENCDFLITIPLKGKIQSLNVSVAAGVLLFEIERQRNL